MCPVLIECCMWEQAEACGLPVPAIPSSSGAHGVQSQPGARRTPSPIPRTGTRRRLMLCLQCRPEPRMRLCLWSHLLPCRDGQGGHHRRNDERCHGLCDGWGGPGGGDGGAGGAPGRSQRLSACDALHLGLHICDRHPLPRGQAGKSPLRRRGRVTRLQYPGGFASSTRRSSRPRRWTRSCWRWLGRRLRRWQQLRGSRSRSGGRRV